MKTISQKQLKKLTENKWIVEHITNPDTSKEDALKMLSEIFGKFSDDNNRVLLEVANRIDGFIEHQKKLKRAEPPLVIDAKKSEPKKWRFDIKRNREGFIETITAVEKE